ncbi:ERAP1-like C-terminal domain-containing protein, partial [Mycobacteroides abscessus]
PASLDLPGLTVDTDLRWRIVNALAASGALEPDASVFIDTELERDQTAAGKRQAAQARAARPVAEVKEAAWKQVIEDDSLPNITARSVIAGIVQPGQAELLAPFSGRYFDVIEDVWARRSSEVAQTVVIGLYPSWDISPEALGLADAFLAKEVPSALRRLVSEGRAGIVRSLRAREFDAGS